MSTSRTKVESFTDNAIDTTASQPLPDEDIDLVRATTAASRADETALVRKLGARSVSGQISHAAVTLVDASGRRLTNEEFREVRSRRKLAAEMYYEDKAFREIEKEHRKAARLTEQRTIEPYAEGSPHSWMLDNLAVSGQSFGSSGRVDVASAEQRLHDHGLIVAEAVDKRSRYGRMIEAQWSEEFRQVDERRNRETVEKMLGEYRHGMRSGVFTETRTGLTTGGGATASASGGGAAAFVTPLFLLDQFAIYRSPYRTLADQLATADMPTYGLQVNVPSFTAGVTVGTTTEGNSTAEGDPTIVFIAETVAQKSGQLTISQAVIDRTGPGIGFDVWAMAQLKDALGAQVDTVAITAMIANPNTITDSSSFSFGTASGVGGFLTDLRKAKAKTMAAGTSIRSTHLFTNEDLADYIEAWSDAQDRPIFQPHYSDPPQLKVAGDPDGLGWTGYCLAGLAHFADNNIPTTGTANLEQLIVTNPSYTVLLEGAPRFQIMPQYQAQNLNPIINVRAYVACVPRYSAAVSVITGGAYAASNFA